MSDFLRTLLQWINTHPELAGVAVFLISAAESIAIIGTIVPGTVMMTAIGTLAGSGVLPLGATIIWAILGAVVGDGISYWFGYYFKDRIHSIWPFRNYPSLLAGGEKFFKKHGGKSVFIGRFVGPVRALVPMIAGMLGMHPWRFTIANVTSAIGWAPAYMLPGIALGAASLELPADIAVHAILMLLLLGLFIILCLWIFQKIFLLISHRFNRTLTHFGQYLQNSRYFSFFTVALKHYNPEKAYIQFNLAFYFIITSALFIYLAIYISLHGSQHVLFNDLFFHLFRSLRSPDGETVMLFITLLGQNVILFPVMIILFVWLAVTNRWRTAWHVLALGILTVISVELVKNLVYSPRPWGIVHSPNGASFPSGHTTLALITYVGLALLLAKTCSTKLRRFFYFLAGIIVFAVAISRLYLGAHWFSDVLGGLLLGAALLIFIAISYNQKEEKYINPVRLGIVCFLALLLSYSLFAFYNYDRLKQNYTLKDWPIGLITQEGWWNQTDKNFPFYRLNRFGISSQILNLQWMGNLPEIKSVLELNNWEVPSEIDWITVLHRISDVQSTEHLPIVSPLYLDKKPVLVLVKHDPLIKKLIVLRLWNSYTKVDNLELPLWVGTVETAPRTYSWLFKRTGANDVNLSTALLFDKIPAQYEVKETKVINKNRRRPEVQTIILIKPKHF